MREPVLNPPQALQILIKDNDICADPERRFRCGLAYRAGAKDNNESGLNPGNSSQDNASAAIPAFQIPGRNLDRHLAGDLAHRLEHRKIS